MTWVIAIIDFILIASIVASGFDLMTALLISIPIGIALEFAHRFFFPKSYQEQQTRSLGPVSGKRIFIALAIGIFIMFGLLVIALLDK